MEPSPKFVCRGPIQLCRPSTVQKPQARGPKPGRSGTATRNVASRPKPEMIELFARSQIPPSSGKISSVRYASRRPINWPSYAARSSSRTSRDAARDDRGLRADPCRPEDLCRDRAVDLRGLCRSSVFSSRGMDSTAIRPSWNTRSGRWSSRAPPICCNKARASGVRGIPFQSKMCESVSLAHAAPRIAHVSRRAIRTGAKCPLLRKS